MRHHWSKNRRIDGFVLPYTLWLLLGGVSLFALVSALALGRARETAASRDRLKLMASAESAVHETIFRLLASGSPALKGSTSFDYGADGVRSHVVVVHSEGLLDVNTADDGLARQLLSASGFKDAGLLADDMRRLRPFNSYAQLLPLADARGADLGCFLELVTLFSQKRVPIVESAPAFIRQALALEAKSLPDAVAAPPAGLAGSVVRMSVDAVGAGGSGSRLMTDVLFTGRVDRPFGAVEWIWLPKGSVAEQSAGAGGCVSARS
jgi:hypothetical protein